MVSIITVNYNGLADTCEMIASFRKHETHPYEIIVVDNGSRMPEADEIKLQPPRSKSRTKHQYRVWPEATTPD